MKNIINSVSCALLAVVMTFASGPVLADVYGFSADNGMIYLTDNNEGNNFELIAKEPVIQNEEILSVADQMTRKPKGYLSNSPKYQLYKDEINKVALALSLIHI